MGLLDADTFGLDASLWGAVLGAASLALTHEIPVTPVPSCSDLKCLQERLGGSVR